ncbi:MAG: hypothetical protein M5U29_15345 [Anaerolineae bacterium]|nr:hypothetical protein [Anaerolineae bacterium]
MAGHRRNTARLALIIGLAALLAGVAPTPPPARRPTWTQYGRSYRDGCCKRWASPA